LLITYRRENTFGIPRYSAPFKTPPRKWCLKYFRGYIIALITSRGLAVAVKRLKYCPANSYAESCRVAPRRVAYNQTQFFSLSRARYEITRFHYRLWTEIGARSELAGNIMEKRW